MRRRIIVYNDGVTRTIDDARNTGRTDGLGEKTEAARRIVNQFILGALSRSDALQTLMTEGFSGQTAARIIAANASKLFQSDGVGAPEEVAYGEGWHSASNSNPYDEPALKAAWEKGRAARKQKQKMNTNYRRGESRGKNFEPPRQRTSNDMSRDYKSEKGYVAKLVDVTTGAILARSEPHISNGVALKAWTQAKARELIQRGKRVKAEVVVVFFDPNMA
jgi:hypothetical protein